MSEWRFLERDVADTFASYSRDAWEEIKAATFRDRIVLGNIRKRLWAKGKRERKIGERVCKLCGSGFDLTAWHQMRGTISSSHCSRRCRWMARMMKFSVNGKVDTFLGHASRHGLSPQVVRYRMKQLGWSVERALSAPMQRVHLGDDRARELRRRRAAGETSAALAKEFGVSRGTVWSKTR